MIFASSDLLHLLLLQRGLLQFSHYSEKLIKGRSLPIIIKWIFVINLWAVICCLLIIAFNNFPLLSVVCVRFVEMMMAATAAAAAERHSSPATQRPPSPPPQLTPPSPHHLRALSADVVSTAENAQLMAHNNHPNNREEEIVLSWSGVVVLGRWLLAAAPRPVAAIHLLARCLPSCWSAWIITIIINWWWSLYYTRIRL